MDGYFSKKKFFFFFLWLPLGWRKFSVLRGWNKVEEQMTGSLPSLPPLPPHPPSPPRPRSGPRGSVVGGPETEAGSRCLGSSPRSPAPHPSTPPPSWASPPGGGALRCRGAGGGGAHPAGCGQEAEGVLPAPASPGGSPRPHAPSSRDPRNMSAAGAQSGAPGRRTRGGRVPRRRRPRPRSR